MYTFRLRSKT